MQMDKKSINVFIASSNALLSEDREHFTRIFEEINGNILPHLRFEPRRWKENLAGGSFEGFNIQDEVDTKLFDDCEIVFVIVYSKIGKYTKYEFNRALRDGKKVFVYFKKGFTPFDVKSAEEYAEVFRFKEQAQNQGVIISEYGTKDDLQKEVQKDIILLSRDRYPIEDQSIAKMFESIRQTLTEEQIKELIYFLILPIGPYQPKDIFTWFSLSASEKDVAREAFKVLCNKGILLEKNEFYEIHPIIKNLLEAESEVSYTDYTSKILQRFKKNIEDVPSGQSVSSYQSSIKIIEDFVGSKVFKTAKSTLGLRKSLANYYLNLGLPRYIAKAEKILSNFENDNLDDNGNIEFTTALANVYYNMYLLMKDEKNELYEGEGKSYLGKSKALFDNLEDGTLHPMSYSNVLRLLIELERSDGFKKLKDNFEKIWSEFDGEYFLDDDQYNINVLEKYLELAIRIKTDNLYVEKIYSNLLTKQENATGPMSKGYWMRSLQFGNYLYSIKKIELLKNVLNKIGPGIHELSNSNNPDDIEILVSYAELMVKVGA